MKILKTLLLAVLVVMIVGTICGVLLIRRGFRATASPSAVTSAPS